MVLCPNEDTETEHLVGWTDKDTDSDISVHLKYKWTTMTLKNISN